MNIEKYCTECGKYGTYQPNDTICFYCGEQDSFSMFSCTKENMSEEISNMINEVVTDGLHFERKADGVIYVNNSQNISPSLSAKTPECKVISAEEIAKKLHAYDNFLEAMECETRSDTEASMAINAILHAFRMQFCDYYFHDKDYKQWESNSQ